MKYFGRIEEYTSLEDLADEIAETNAFMRGKEAI